MKNNIGQILEFYEFETIEEAAEHYGLSTTSVCRLLEEQYEDDSAWLA